MREYKFKELSVGMKESFEREITPEMERAFRTISGDDNPLHRDDDFARETGRFPEHAVFGMLTASFYSTMAGMYLPGKHSLIHSFDEISFLKPVFSGDRLTITGEVTGKEEGLSMIRLKVTIKNQGGKTVSRAKMKVLVLA